MAIFALACAQCLSGCMTYSGFPKKDAAGEVARASDDRFYYTIVGNALFNGEIAIRDVFEHRSPFDVAEPVNEVSPKGIYVRATIMNLPPSVASGVFGYIALSTAFITPVWSTEDGYRVSYEVYRDGEKQRTFDYEFRRQSFAWLGMLPFVWVNLLTSSEHDGFEATTLQFFRDAARYWKRDSAAANRLQIG